MYKGSQSIPIVEILWWNETQNYDQKNQNKSYNDNVASHRMIKQFVIKWNLEISKSYQESKGIKIIRILKHSMHLFILY